MLVCHCKSVSEREVKEAIRSGACSRRDVARRCAGAGTMCGGCRPLIDELLDTHEVAPAVQAFELAAAS